MTFADDSSTSLLISILFFEFNKKVPKQFSRRPSVAMNVGFVSKNI